MLYSTQVHGEVFKKYHENSSAADPQYIHNIRS